MEKKDYIKQEFKPLTDMGKKLKETMLRIVKEDIPLYEFHRDLGVVMVGDEEFYNEVVTIRGHEYGFLTQKIMLDACAHPTTTRSRIILAFIEGINESYDSQEAIK